MALTQVIFLTMKDFGVHRTVHMVQNDSGRLLKMVVDDVAIADGSTGEVAFKRSDGSTYTESASFTLSDNSFTVDMSQGLTKPGNTECELKVTYSSEIVSTFPFTVIVHESTDGLNQEQYGYTVEEVMDAIAGVQNFVNELLDIRTGYDGTEYDSAGNAVRDQITQGINALIRVGGMLEDLGTQVGALSTDKIPWPVVGMGDGGEVLVSSGASQPEWRTLQLSATDDGQGNVEITVSTI